MKYIVIICQNNYCRQTLRLKIPTNERILMSELEVTCPKCKSIFTYSVRAQQASKESQSKKEQPAKVGFLERLFGWSKKKAQYKAQYRVRKGTRALQDSDPNVRAEAKAKSGKFSEAIPLLKKDSTQEPAELEQGKGEYDHTIAVSCYEFEGTLVLCTDRLAIFHALCERDRIAMLSAPVTKYNEVVQETLKYFTERFGSQSDFSMASTDMRLLCPKCGYEYGDTHLNMLTLRAFGNTRTLIFGTSTTTNFDMCCSKCANVDALFLFDNWKPIDIDRTDIDALKKFGRFQAEEYFRYGQIETSFCDLCDDAQITINNAYLLSTGHGRGRLVCSQCFNDYLNKVLNKLRENPHYCGPRNARNFVEGKYENKLTLIKIIDINMPT